MSIYRVYVVCMLGAIVSIIILTIAPNIHTKYTLYILTIWSFYVIRL